MPLDVVPLEFARRHLRTGRDLAREQRSPTEAPLATGSPLDALLGGGLPRGALTELVGTARFSLLLQVLASVTGTGEAAALVDLGDGLDPRAAAAAGVDLETLLWVRPRTTKEVLASAEALLEVGLPLLAIDLGLPPLAGGRGAEASWLRLARSALQRRTALFLSTPYRASGTAAQVVVETQRARGQWQTAQGRREHRRGDVSVPLLDAVSGHLLVLKGPGWRDAAGAPLHWTASRPVAPSPDAPRPLEPPVETPLPEAIRPETIRPETQPHRAPRRAATA